MGCPESSAAKSLRLFPGCSSQNAGTCLTDILHVKLLPTLKTEDKWPLY